MDTPYVREYHEDREITAWFLLDLSPSVDFGTVETDREKRTVLIDFVTTLARLLTRRGNRVGAIFYGGQVEQTIPARGGRDQVLRLIQDLLDQPRLDGAPPTDLTPLLDDGQPGDQAALARRSSSRTSSASPAGSARSSCSSARHEVLAVRLVDPREIELPDVGPIIMEDAETGEQLYVDTGNAQFRRRFQEAAVLARDADHARPSGGPASRRSRSRPTTTSSGRSSGWRRSGAGGGRPDR